jgi:hypothetical protein
MELGHTITASGHTYAVHVAQQTMFQDMVPLQVENKCQVRALIPTPKQGELPVPKDLTATPAPTWEQLPLDKAVCEGGPPKSHPNSVLDFKVRS